MRYTQAGFFTPATNKIKTLPEVLGATHTAHVGAHPDAGFRLGQYARALRAHGLKVEARLTDGSQNAARIRAELISNLAERGNFVIVKYNRIALGQLGGNHMSPLGAYDDRSDSFLVMDVDPSAGPWVWIRSSDLIAAMRASDRGDDRGYVLVSDKVLDPRAARIASRKRHGTVRTLALEK
jgi:hypothetical protein